MIKILDLRDSAWVDGPGRTVLETAGALDKSKYHFVIAGFRTGKYARNDYLDAARDRGLDTLEVVENSAVDLAAVRQVLNAIGELRIDIIHTHDFRTNVFGLFCARQNSLPIMTTCHGWIANDLKSKVYRKFDKALLKRFDQVIAVSHRMRNQLAAHGVDERRIAVVVNALSIDKFVPNDSDTRFRQELEVSDSTVLIASIGRLSAEKGQSLLLGAVAMVRKHYSDLVVALVGQGKDENVLRQLSEQLGISDIIRFVGHRSDMANIYNSVDLVIQSSYTEGMPNVILESLLMRTPVIATDVGGTSEILKHLETGYLIPPGSKECIIHGLLNFLEERGLHESFALRGRSHVIEHFNQDDRARRMADLYSSVVEKKV